jgi:hypothetical protein
MFDRPILGGAGRFGRLNRSEKASFAGRRTSTLFAGRHVLSSPEQPARGLARERLGREQEHELERKAELYSRLHGGDDQDEAESRPGPFARVLKRIRRWGR